MKNVYLLLAAVVWMIQSCTIQKRQHLPGYHIEWNSNESHSSVQKTNKEKLESASPTEDFTAVTTEDNTIDSQEAITPVVSGDELTPKVTEPVVVKSEVKRDQPSKAHRLTFPTIIHSPVKLLFGGVKPEDKPRTDGMSIAAMVCGIVGVLIPGTGIILSILAIIFGGIGMGRTSRNSELKGKGMAITGLVLGIVGLLVTVALLAFISSYWWY
jgi:hypothetical protein